MISPSRPPPAGAVARHYDELDHFYREVWGEDLHHGLWLRGDEDPEEATRALTERVAERAGIAAGDRVCDVGCGYGGAARLLADRFGARVLGITLSEVQVRHARSRIGERSRLRFLLADWLEGPLSAGIGDAVIAIESVSHMADKAAFFSEARRVLRPGGRLVVAAWTAAERIDGWRRRHLLEPLCREGHLAGLGTPSEYRRWLAGSGLELHRQEDLSDRVRRTWSICLRRLTGRLLWDRETWRYLLDGDHTERRFALAVVRIWIAYRIGALRYTLFTARSPVVRSQAPAPS